MRAIQMQRTGGPEVLQLVDRPDPEPGPGQVSVRVGAVGVNFIEIYERTGVYPKALPLIPGTEAAGTVVGVGDGVANLSVGDRVASVTFDGSYTEVAIGPADKMFPVPDTVDDETAATLALQGFTAHYLATDSFRISAGDTVLIHAGAGGVGQLLTQIAKLKGARVFTTVSTDAKAAVSRGAGADEVFVGYGDFATRARELTGGAGVSAVYDGVGKDTFDGSLASIAVRGTLVLFGGASGQVPPFDVQRLNRAGSLFLTRPKLLDHTRTTDEIHTRAANLFSWVADKRLTVTIDAKFPLAEAGRAHDMLQSRRATGKLLLLP